MNIRLFFEKTPSRGSLKSEWKTMRLPKRTAQQSLRNGRCVGLKDEQSALAKFASCFLNFIEPSFAVNQLTRKII